MKMVTIKKIAGVFRVDGVTLVTCKKKATKQLHTWQVDKRRPTQSEYESEFKRVVADLMESMKPCAISKEFSSPEIATEYLELTQATTPKDEYRDLKIMIHQPAFEKGGAPKRNKKTFKQVMTWAPYDPSFDYKELAAKATKKAA